MSHAFRWARESQTHAGRDAHTQHKLWLTHHYVLNACGPQNLYVEVLTPNVMVFGDGVLGNN